LKAKKKIRIQRKKKQKGVALIFFTLIFAVFIGFSMMILNSGKLIYEKMRLQSAADLASYAGASVQASYLGDEASKGDSIRNINNQIIQRYFKLLRDLDFGSVSPWPGGTKNIFNDPGTCAVACLAANLANGQYVVRLYQQAVSDIQNDHDKVRRILQQMPKAVQTAVESTMASNIPELSVQSSSGFGTALSQTTDSPKEVMSGGTQNIFQQKKNAVLTFSSDKGMYLTNVTAPVPHSFVYYGPTCAARFPESPTHPLYYCTVNGQGSLGGQSGFQAAYFAFLQGVAGGKDSGNIGRIDKIAKPDSNAIRLQFVENAFKPEPFVVVSAEWYPKVGNQMNLENSLGAKGSVFPQRSRLIAVSAAEPFGSSLASNFNLPFGVRLQGIRKLLLNPNIKSVQSDYNDLFDYMAFVGPHDDSGTPMQTADEVIKRFLH